MEVTDKSGILFENKLLTSAFLNRQVELDIYLPQNCSDPGIANLLLINDGQDLPKMPFIDILENLGVSNCNPPMISIGIYASEERKMEYGVAAQADYSNRGAKAKQYSDFVIRELLPFIRSRFPATTFNKKAFAGFSLGGLTALDIVWNHPEEFTAAGVFSGSLWWRSIDQHHEDYDDDKHRIMHQVIRNGEYKQGLKFFFTTGSLDETKDRNNNGIIDSIDDTLGLISELEKLGYQYGRDIFYINYPEGKHDIATWGKALPEFLHWLY